MVFYIELKLNVFMVCFLVSCSYGKCTDINVVLGHNSIDKHSDKPIEFFYTNSLLIR